MICDKRLVSKIGKECQLEEFLLVLLDPLYIFHFGLGWHSSNFHCIYEAKDLYQDDIYLDP